MSEIIRMNKICRTYKMGGDELRVLKDVDFSVQQGEFVAVLGPSGSGKSTLMNIIGCMDKATSGEYELDGNAVHKMNDYRMTKIRNDKIGFVFQKYHLISQYSVLQNIIMPLVIRGMSHKKARERAMETIKLLGLEERLKHKPSELSGGQQQRVAIARALATDVGIILADEPTGNLDTENSNNVIGILSKLAHEEKMCVVIVTHDLAIAELADQVYRMKDGNFVES